MSFDPRRYRVPISVQVGVVAALFIAALIVLWSTARRSSRASGAGPRPRVCSSGRATLLTAGGRDIIAGAGEFPNFAEEPSRDRLNRELSARA